MVRGVRRLVSVLLLGRGGEFYDRVGQQEPPPVHGIVFLPLEHDEGRFGSDSRSAPIDSLAYAEAVSSPINSRPRSYQNEGAANCLTISV
jgi:hypothetical protein